MEVIPINSEFILKWMALRIFNNFIVVYPNAEFINNLRQWNLTYDVSPQGVFPVIPDDVGFVDSLIDFFIANYAIDTNRIYTCGMSAGAL